MEAMARDRYRCCSGTEASTSRLRMRNHSLGHQDHRYFVRWESGGQICWFRSGVVRSTVRGTGCGRELDEGAFFEGHGDEGDAMLCRR